MSINKKVMVTKTCDLCGKQEGVHLKKKRFFHRVTKLSYEKL